MAFDFLPDQHDAYVLQQAILEIAMQTSKLEESKIELERALAELRPGSWT
ncbi:hypothetical protein [Bifidobacterium platyrrhinorum]|nr:hypothetical protein [Bifidobacterium platyrrhinorum]